MIESFDRIFRIFGPRYCLQAHERYMALKLGMPPHRIIVVWSRLNLKLDLGILRRHVKPQSLCDILFKEVQVSQFGSKSVAMVSSYYKKWVYSLGILPFEWLYEILS